MEIKSYLGFGQGASDITGYYQDDREFAQHSPWALAPSPGPCLGSGQGAFGPTMGSGLQWGSFGAPAWAPAGGLLWGSSGGLLGAPARLLGKEITTILTNTT